MPSMDISSAESKRLILVSRILFVVCILVSVVTNASPPVDRLVPRLKGYLNSPYGYWEYLPKDYHEAANQPVVIYLHGVKEIGNGHSIAELEKVTRNGVPHMIKRFQRDYPFVLIAPQSPGVEEGFSIENMDTLIEIIKANYRVDEDRIYVTGVSYGGYATLRLAARLPHKLAAIVPFSSCGGENDVREIAKVPMWAFANDGDKREVPACMEQLVESIRDHGGTPLLTIYSRKGHNSWYRTYKQDFMWTWLLKQKRIHKNENQAPVLIHPGNKTVAIGALADFTIMASDGNNDSLRFTIESPLASGSHLVGTKNGYAHLIVNTLTPGLFNIAVSVSDKKGGMSRQTFFLRTNYSLLLFPHFLVFIVLPFIIELPHTLLSLLPSIVSYLIGLLLSPIGQFFYWLFITIQYWIHSEKLGGEGLSHKR